MGCGASSSGAREGFTAKDTLQLSARPRRQPPTEGSPTVWVGGIPADSATPDALQRIFAEFGHVLSCKVRYKPGAKKSWAFVTFETSGAASKAIAGPVTVVERGARDRRKRIFLKVERADVEGERERTRVVAEIEERKQYAEEDAEDAYREAVGKKPRRRSLQSDSLRETGLGFDSSAREKLWAEEQAGIERRALQKARVLAKDDDEKARLDKASVPWPCSVCEAVMPVSKEICGVCRRGRRPADRYTAPKLTVSTVSASREAVPSKAVATALDADDVGATIHADSFTASRVKLAPGSGALQQQLSAPWCTAWVGSIPSSLLGLDDDSAKRRLRQLFDEHGRILSVTIRRKKDGRARRGSTGSFRERAVFKSWALITFESALGVRRAIAAGATARCADGTEVALRVAPAQIDQQLRRSDTGALAKIWGKQQEEVEAACTIQAAVRGRRHRSSSSKSGGGRRRSSAEGRRRSSAEGRRRSSAERQQGQG